MEYLDKQSAKKVVYETNVSLHQKKLAIQSFGNTSNRIKDGFIIKPSGVDLNQVKTEKMVEVSNSGSFSRSGLKPSIDEPTHRVIYENFKEIGGIVHTHSKFATSFAKSTKPILSGWPPSKNKGSFKLGCSSNAAIISGAKGGIPGLRGGDVPLAITVPSRILIIS